MLHRTENVRFDLAIVGASVAGCAVAALATERGMSVAVYEARAREELHRPRPRCPVPVWALEEARLPVGEVASLPRRLHVVAGSERVAVDAPDCVLVERGAMIASLLERAIAAGARFSDRSPIGCPDETDARFVIDASGSDGARLLGEQAPSPADVVSIAEETRPVVDAALARAYHAVLGVAGGDTVAFVAAPAIIVWHVHEDRAQLTAMSLDGEARAPTARAVLRNFAREHAFLGDAIAAETRHVPIAGPRAAVSSGEVALIGGAAGLARPDPGAEVATGIVSARMLVDAVARGELGRYDRRVRARFARSARFDRALAESLRVLDEDDFAGMIASGAVGPELVRAMVEQRSPRLPTTRFLVEASVRRLVRIALTPLAAPRLALLGARR